MERKSKAYFPLFVDLSEKKVLVVGGGKIAARRVGTLWSFCGYIKVVAPEVSEEILKLAGETQEVTGEPQEVLGETYEAAGETQEMNGDGPGLLLEIEKRKFMPKDLDGADLVLAATNDPAVDEEVFALCRQLDIPVNVASDKKKCDFYFPAIVQDENIVVGITSSGESHKRAKEMREGIEKIFQILNA